MGSQKAFEELEGQVDSIVGSVEQTEAEQTAVLVLRAQVAQGNQTENTLVEFEVLED